jgi:hypothetical protein
MPDQRVTWWCCSALANLAGTKPRDARGWLQRFIHNILKNMDFFSASGVAAPCRRARLNLFFGKSD